MKNELGVSAKDMSIKDIRALAVQFGLVTEEEASKTKKSDLLSAITKHEEKLLAESEGFKRVEEVEEESVVATEEVETHNGKKVISKNEIEHNGKKYMDILVETGETYRELL